MSDDGPDTSTWTVTEAEGGGAWIGNPDNPHMFRTSCSKYLVAAKIEDLLHTILREYGHQSESHYISEKDP